MNISNMKFEKIKQLSNVSQINESEVTTGNSPMNTYQYHLSSVASSSRMELFNSQKMSCLTGYNNANVKDHTAQKYRILHIEDDEGIRFLVKAFLKNYAEVDSAVDGVDALNHIYDKKYDFIITDINLGEGIDGIEATRKIRNMSHCRNIPVIAASASMDTGIKSQCVDAGMNAFLMKPFLKKDLIGTIENVLNSKLQ